MLLLLPLSDWDIASGFEAAYSMFSNIADTKQTLENTSADLESYLSPMKSRMNSWMDFDRVKAIAVDGFTLRRRAARLSESTVGSVATSAGRTARALWLK